MTVADHSCDTAQDTHNPALSMPCAYADIPHAPQPLNNPLTTPRISELFVIGKIYIYKK